MKRLNDFIEDIEKIDNKNIKIAISDIKENATSVSYTRDVKEGRVLISLEFMDKYNFTFFKIRYYEGSNEIVSYTDYCELLLD